MSVQRLIDVDWAAPFDVNAYVAGIPGNATIKGVFPSAVAEAARRKGVTLRDAREKYHPFGDVPLREYAPMLAECATVLYPQLSMREGLRKLGRASLDALSGSTVGRVLITSLLDFRTSLLAIGKATSIISASSRVELREYSDGRALIAYTSVYTFVDTHHIGILEKLASASSVRVKARVCMRSPYDGEIELTW